MNGPSVDAVRAAGAAVFRELALANRTLAAELGASREQGLRQALAAVEALELVDDALAGLQATLEPDSRRTMTAVLAGAWERLLESGLETDGTPGERVDPARHRVVQSGAPPGRLPNRVTAVFRRGVSWQGRRARPAEVAADYAEGGDDTHRD